MTHIVVHHVVAHRVLRRLLHFTGDGGVHAIAIFIGLVTIAIHHLLANHFGQVRGREGDLRGVVVSVNDIVTRLVVLALADVAFAQHT